jgi:hypothetical protein
MGLCTAKARQSIGNTGKVLIDDRITEVKLRFGWRYPMRRCWRVLVVAIISLATASGRLVGDEIERHEPDFDMFASMAGKCSALKVAQRDFACTTVAFFHSPGGRASFTVPLKDPDDDTHIITFSGEKSKRAQADPNMYELSVDQMLLKSKDRPKIDGLPVPSVVQSTGACKQIGNFAAQQVSSVSCVATDANGNTYQFQFESDGSPIRVQMIRASEPTIRVPDQIIRVSDPAADENRAKALAAHIEQLKCRQKADAQGVLPRDRTAFILKCIDEE